MKRQTYISFLPCINKQISNPISIFPKCEYSLYFDGCSKGNPGHSGIGAVIYKDDVEIWCSFKYLGPQETNNRAEYFALLMGLTQATVLHITELYVFGDSLLVINQVNEVYKVNNMGLLEVYNEVINLKPKFNYIEFKHVYRDKNKRADKLSNMGVNLYLDTKPIFDKILF
jgi:ribonuclease HI